MQAAQQGTGNEVLVVQPVMLAAEPQVVQPQMMLPPAPQVIMSQPQMMQHHQVPPQSPIGGFGYSQQNSNTTQQLQSPTDVARANHVGPAPPKGAPYGGMWKVEKYCGCTSFALTLMCIPVCCCPCDERRTYIAPDGKKYRIGETKSCCFC